MREFAIVALNALDAGVEELAGKIVMHIETLVSLRATIHKIKLAQFHLAGWQSIVRERTVFASVTLALHVIHADLIRFRVIVVLLATIVPIVPSLVSIFVFAAFVFATATSYKRTQNK